LTLRVGQAIISKCFKKLLSRGAVLELMGYRKRPMADNASISLSDVDARINELQMEINNLRLVRIQIKALAERLSAQPHAVSQTVDRAIKEKPISRPKANGRRQEIINFILKNGPHTRKEISEKTGIPAGSIHFEMGKKAYFWQRSDRRWDVTNAVKAGELR
jgi:hypothetical protein